MKSFDDIILSKPLKMHTCKICNKESYDVDRFHVWRNHHIYVCRTCWMDRFDDFKNCKGEDAWQRYLESSLYGKDMCTKGYVYTKTREKSY